MNKFKVGDRVVTNDRYDDDVQYTGTVLESKTVAGVGRAVVLTIEWDNNPYGEPYPLSEYYFEHVQAVTEFSREDWLLLADGLLNSIKNPDVDKTIVNRAVALIRRITQEKL